MTFHAAILTAILLGVSSPGAFVAATEQVAVGILPFDTSAVDGASGVGQNLAKVVRLEMIRSKQLLPRLLELPAGATMPLEPSKAAEAGRSGEVAFVIIGTVLDATVKNSSNRASAGAGKLGRLSANVARSSANVELHIQVVESATARLVDTFEVKGSNSDTGLATDLSSTLGTFGLGDAAWQGTPMGKAVREAAEKLTVEVARRTSKIKTVR